MAEVIETSGPAAMIYDPSVIREISAERFTAAGWLHAEPVGGAAGRGTTLYVGNVPRQFVLRHYIRGGLVGRFVRDRYVFTGQDATRPFREWRLLAKLADRGMRVPRPAGARYLRAGPFYTADLITVRIPGVDSLSTCIAAKRRNEGFWSGVGAAVREFHEQGLYHADMNAHNLMIDAAANLWMIDLDRGELRAPGPWQQKTLARLRRSLDKIAAADPQVSFAAENWEQLLAGYFDASRSA